MPTTGIKRNNHDSDLSILLPRSRRPVRGSRVRPGVLVRDVPLGPDNQTQRERLRSGLCGQHERDLRRQIGAHVVQSHGVFFRCWTCRGRGSAERVGGCGWFGGAGWIGRCFDLKELKKRGRGRE